MESEVVGVDGADPVWNEIVTFDITTGREPVIVQVFDGTASRLVGESEVYLDLLIDQYKHDEWVQL